MEITGELKQKALACKTVEELLALAADNGIELSAEEAGLILGSRTEGELTDEELGNVAGGSSCSKRNTYERVYWKSHEEVQFLFKEDDIVEAFPLGFEHHTATCKVVSLERNYDPDHGWCDRYWLEKVPGSKTVIIKGWRYRDEIEK